MWEISRHCTHEPHFKNSVQVFQSVKYTHGAVILSYKVLLYLAPASLPNLSLTSLCLAAMLSVCVLNTPALSSLGALAVGVLCLKRICLAFFFCIEMSPLLWLQNIKWSLLHPSSSYLPSQHFLQSVIILVETTSAFSCLNSQHQKQILACFQ